VYAKPGNPDEAGRADLNQPVELYDIDCVESTDTNGVDRAQARQHHAKRTDYAFEAVKTTLLIDNGLSAILDIYS
jgi:hypothetical protein